MRFMMVVAAALVLAGCNDDRYSPAQVPKFDHGEIVRMKAFGMKGMVVGITCWRGYKEPSPPCYYSIRFAAIQARTNTHLFSADGPIDFAPVALVKRVKEFEIESVEP